MDRKLVCISEQMLPSLDKSKWKMVARNRTMKVTDGEPIAKLLTAFVRKADEGTLSGGLPEPRITALEVFRYDFGVGS